MNEVISQLTDDSNRYMANCNRLNDLRSEYNKILRDHNQSVTANANSNSFYRKYILSNNLKLIQNKRKVQDSLKDMIQISNEIANIKSEVKLVTGEKTAKTMIYNHNVIKRVKNNINPLLDQLVHKYDTYVDNKNKHEILFSQGIDNDKFKSLISQLDNLKAECGTIEEENNMLTQRIADHNFQIAHMTQIMNEEIARRQMEEQLEAELEAEMEAQMKAQMELELKIKRDKESKNAIKMKKIRSKIK